MILSSHISVLDQETILYSQGDSQVEELSTGILFLEEGVSKVRIGGKVYVAKAPAMIIVPVSHSLSEVEPSQSRAKYFSVSFKAMRLLIDSSVTRMTLFAGSKQDPIRSLDNYGVSVLNHFFFALEDVAKSSRCSDKFNTLRHLALALYFGFLADLMGNPNEFDANSNSLTIQFLQLVSKECTKHRFVSFYASSLCVSSQYLSVMVKSASGHSPKEWIEDYLMTEACSLLSEEELTIGQISEMLHFDSESQFSKFFKHKSGISPSSYRVRDVQE